MRKRERQTDRERKIIAPRVQTAKAGWTENQIMRFASN